LLIVNLSVSSVKTSILTVAKTVEM